MVREKLEKRVEEVVEYYKDVVMANYDHDIRNYERNAREGKGVLALTCLTRAASYLWFISILEEIEKRIKGELASVLLKEQMEVDKDGSLN